MSQLIGVITVSMLLALSALVFAVEQSHTLPAALAGLSALGIILSFSRKAPARSDW